MSERIAQSRFFNRLFHIIVPVLAWLTITLPVWLSPFHPAIVAYFILSFNIYFFYKSAVTMYYAVLSYKTINIHQKIPYSSKLKKLGKAKDIYHFIVIPNYKEPLHKLDESLEQMAKMDYPYRKPSIVLAFESREEDALMKANALIAKHKKSFSSIIQTYHTLLPGEAAGKASNQSYACQQIEKLCKKEKIPFSDTLITIADADSMFPKNYFSYLTYEFLKDSDNQYHFYWAPVLLYNNFWQLPFFMRMQATLSSIFRLAFLSQKKKLIQISTYSTNLWLLKRLNYWDTDIIPEDWHIYFQAFFKFGDRVRTLPLFTIINADAVYSGGVFKTLVNRYEQEKRWAWGVSDIGYALVNSFKDTSIPFTTKMRKIMYLVETHLLWPTSFFILTVSALIPPLINPVFKRTVLGFLLPQFSSFVLTLSTSFLLVYTYLDVKLRKKLKQKTSAYSLPFLIIQWYLLPIVSFVLSSLPALDAHTRMIFGKKLDYKVTEKV